MSSNVSKVLNVVLLVAVLILIIKVVTVKNPDKAKPQDNGNIAIENIMNRKSVRSFTDKKVTKEQLDTLLRAAMSAPSARNQQPWSFVVIDDRALLDELASELPYAKMLKESPCAIVVCGDLSKALEGDGQAYWIQDCSAATENLLLAVEAMGLGAVWTGVYPIQERVKSVKSVLQLPMQIIPLNVIPIGYPKTDTPVKDKYKRENIHWNEW